MKLILTYKSIACDETKLPYEKKIAFPDTVCGRSIN